MHLAKPQPGLQAARGSVAVVCEKDVPVLGHGVIAGSMSGNTMVDGSMGGDMMTMIVML